MHESERARQYRLKKDNLQGVEWNEVDVEKRTTDIPLFLSDTGPSENTAREELQSRFDAFQKPPTRIVYRLNRIWLKLNLTNVVSGLQRLGLKFALFDRSDKPRGSVHMPPGAFARRLLHFLFSKKAFEAIFAQAIIDMREEHAEALAGSELWKAKWIVFRDHINLCLTVAFYLASSMGKKVVGLWKIIP